MDYQGNSKQYIIVICRKFVSLKGSRAFSSHAHILPGKKEKKTLFLSGPINKKLSPKKMLRDDFSSAWQVHGALAKFYSDDVIRAPLFFSQNRVAQIKIVQANTRNCRAS